MSGAIFDIKRDNELIKTGTHFWCQACVVARPVKELSPDPRYCKSCYAFLKAEASLLPATRHPGWTPRAVKDPAPIPSGGSGNMSTVNGVERRGPKRKNLPRQKIFEMADAGMGAKMIAGRLKAEYRMKVSYKTIQRLIDANHKN